MRKKLVWVNVLVIIALLNINFSYGWLIEQIAPTVSDTSFPGSTLKTWTTTGASCNPALESNCDCGKVINCIAQKGQSIYCNLNNPGYCSSTFGPNAVCTDAGKYNFCRCQDESTHKCSKIVTHSDYEKTSPTLTFDGQSCGLQAGHTYADAACADTNGYLPSFQILDTQSKDLPTFMPGEADYLSSPIKDNNYMDMDVLATPYYSVGNTRTVSACNNMCLGYTNIYLEAHTGANSAYLVLGGFMYLNNTLDSDPLTSTPLLLSEVRYNQQDTSKHKAGVYTYFALFNVSPDKTLGSQINLRSNPNYKFLFKSNSNNGWASDELTQSVNPGVYYAFYVIVLSGGGGDTNYIDYTYVTLSHQWWDDPTFQPLDPLRQGGNYHSWSHIPNYAKVNDISNHDFIIYPAILSKQEIISKYDNDTIEKAFCNAPDINGDKNITITTHSGCCWEGSNGVVDVKTNRACTSDGSGYKWTTPTSKDYCENIDGKNGEYRGSFIPGSNTPTSTINSVVGPTDDCCGDDATDYGYISSVNVNNVDRKQYLCYNKTAPSLYDANFGDPNFGYTWLNAVSTRYITTTVNTSKNGIESSVDAISNSEDWYYCNATGTANLPNGIPIAENGTFKNKNNDNTFSCYDLYSAQYASQGITFVNDGCTKKTLGVPDNNCCEFDSGTSNSVVGNDITDCYAKAACHIAGSNDAAPILVDPNAVNSAVDVNSYVLKALCPFDPSNCLNVSFSKDTKCEEQDNDFSPKNTLCDKSTSICRNGVLLNTSGSSGTKLCCFGKDAVCETPIPSISNSAECKFQNGTSYSGSDYSCSGSEVSMSVEQGMCCFGTVSLNYIKLATYQSVQNSSFMCLKQNGQNLISECCYDQGCSNKNLSASTKLISFENKLESVGSVQNTIWNFDSFIDGANSGPIQDYVYKISIPPRTPENTNRFNKVDVMSNPTYLNLTHFTYLEFDFAYNSPDLVLTLNAGQGLDNIYLGKLSDFSTNGDSQSRWHHAVINLKKYAPYVDTFHNLQFTSTSSLTNEVNAPKIVVILDNIILTPTGDDLKYNSLNHYCTGGFEGWIDDLDPPNPKILNPSKWSWKDYGPYMLACNAQAAFGWTGTMCCGDDTKLSNYGEFYNDTEKACFNGSMVSANQTISYVKNVNELSSTNFESYIYKDLLYTNNTFITCQADKLKYNNLFVAPYGDVDPAKTRLISSKTVTDQCSVNGLYYCANGAWRREIKTTDGYKEFPQTPIVLDVTPPGVELLKNGFNG